MIQESRDKFIAEMMIRKKVRKILEGREDLQAIRKQNLDEQKFRKAIRSLIAEAKKSPIPHDNTGINILEDTLKKIIPIVKDSYFALTSDASQRRSYRAHIVNGFRNAIQPYRSISSFDAGASEGDLLARPMQEAEEGEDGSGVEGIDMTIGDNEEPVEGAVDSDGDGIPDAEDKFIETEPEQEIPPEEKEKNDFTVNGEDETGRNLALETFKKIEKNITDAYNILDKKIDKSAFYEYGITNLKLYFDRFEDELSSGAAETEEGAPYEGGA